MDITRCMKNVEDSDVEENTYKHYYFPLSDDEGSYQPHAKRIETIDEFFEEPKNKKRKCSSTVGRSTKNGMVYISSNSDDGTGAAHLIKIEVYNLKKLANIEQNQHWKHAEVRVKYYAKPGDKHNDRTREIIHAITKQIATKEDCEKYFYKNKDE
ncbi:unnamed protein product [Plutella xylostella]|uniref:(diamondback moth) hypothetical protein n=1 Tax=Plutella xylostella TaxID=51655 RepID=A0A8S4DH47_PLUXY|nr:unnamed protein product [Plutella xylostella]CAG9097132.1 unnamed protein product [Plutella xylostella]